MIRKTVEVAASLCVVGDDERHRRTPLDALESEKVRGDLRHSTFFFGITIGEAYLNRDAARDSPGGFHEIGLHMDDQMVPAPFVRKEVFQAIGLKADGAVDEPVLVSAV